jgi:MATE family multidrug resistance protein
LVAYWIVAAPLIFAFASVESLGVRGIWFGLIGGLAVAAVLLLGKLRRVTATPVELLRVVGDDCEEGGL